MTVMPGLCGRFGVSPAIYGPPMLLRQASLTAFHRVLFLRRLNGTAGVGIFWGVDNPPHRLGGMKKMGRRVGGRNFSSGASPGGGGNTARAPLFLHFLVCHLFFLL